MMPSVDMTHFKSCFIMQSVLFLLFLCTLQLLKLNAQNSLGTFTFLNKAFYVLTENPKIRRNHLQAANSCYSIKTLIGSPWQILGSFTHSLKDVLILILFRKRTICCTLAQIECACRCRYVSVWSRWCPEKTLRVRSLNSDFRQAISVPTSCQCIFKLLQKQGHLSLPFLLDRDFSCMVLTLITMLIC